MKTVSIKLLKVVSIVISILATVTQNIAFCADIIVDSYTKAGLPAAGTAGRLARVTDNAQGLWMDDGSQWFSLLGEAVNVQDFGAKGDNTGDQSTALQNAINAKKGIIIFPPGVYRYETTLDLTDDRILLGAGTDTTVLNYAGTGTAIRYLVTSPGIGRRVQIRDLQVQGTFSATHGIHLQRVMEPFTVISGVWVYGFGGHGIYLDETIGATLYDIRSSNNQLDGVRVYKSNRLNLIRVQATGNLQNGFTIDGLGADTTALLTIRDCWSELNAGIGIDVKRRRNFLIEGCWVENNGSHGINLNGTGIGTEAEVGTIFGNHVIGGGNAGASAVGIRLGYATEIQVQNNYVDGFGTLGGDVVFTTNSSNNASWNNYNANGLITPSDSGTNNVRGAWHAGGVKTFLGTGTGTGKAVSGIFSTDTVAGNIGSTETDLLSYTLLANSLTVNKTSVRIKAWGKTAANTATKRLRFYVGTTAVFDTGAIATNNKDWFLDVTVMRSGPSTQVSFSSGIYNNAVTIKTGATSAANDTAAIVLKFTGLSNASNNITQNGMIAEYIPPAP